MEQVGSMEPIGAWSVIVEQSPLVAFMALVIFFGGKYVKSTLDKADKREDAREGRYNQLVDQMLKLQGEQTTAVTTALVGNSAVLARVEKKLDEKTGH